MSIVDLYKFILTTGREPTHATHPWLLNHTLILVMSTAPSVLPLLLLKFIHMTHMQV